MKNLSDVVDNKAAKNTKVKKLVKKIPDTNLLIHINQYNIDKQNLEKN